MIRYPRRFIPKFIQHYWSEYPYNEVGEREISFDAWLTSHGATVHIENDSSIAAVNVIMFADPTDEIAFRLKFDCEELYTQ